MKGRLPPLLVPLSMVVAGVLIGHLLRWIAIGLLWMAFGDSAWPSWLAFPLSFLDIIGGLIGLWVGVRRSPGSSKVIYPLALIVLLISPVLLFLNMRVVRTTPEAAAQAELDRQGVTEPRYVLGQSERQGRGKMQFEIKVKDRDVIFGAISVSRFLGFWWLSDGTTMDDAELKRIHAEMYGEQ